MRLAILTAGLVLMTAQPAFAEWIEYKNPGEAFAVNFPAEPKVQDITYTTASGARVPAKVFSADEGPGHFSVTVLNPASSPADEAGAMAHAAATRRPMGTVK